MTGPDAARHDGGQRYRHLFEHAPICIFVIDLTASPVTILEANRRAELIYGYAAAELMGMPAAHLAPSEAEPAMASIVQQVHQGRTVTVETTNHHRDGTRFPVRVIAAPDPTDSGQMIVTVEDITASRQRRSEAEAIDAERLRIAHEIHDGVAQNLAGLRFKSALWSRLTDAAPPNIQAALAELQAVLLDAISDLRRAIFALRPVDLDAMGFFPALAQLVAGFGDQHQLAARLEVTGPQDALPACYELPLLRVIQQGLNNIGQHAGASSVLLCVAVDPAGGVRVALRDDGRGFDTSQVGPITQTGHFGLRQMRERIVDRGGTLDIAIRAGARGYLLKTVDAGELIASIEAVCRGDYLIDPVVATRVLSELHLHVPRQAPRVDPLTEGEMAVLRLVAQGVDNRDIARALNYSVHTVANRLRIIYEKLHVTNRTQAALYALRQGWAALDDPPA